MADTPVQGHEAVGGASKRGAPDPSVKVPEGVKAAAERANALSAQAKAVKEQNAASGADQPIGSGVRMPVSPPPPSGVITQNFDPSSPNPPDPNDPRLQSRPTPQTPQPPQPQTQEDWEHQFRSLKGRYDRESEEKRRLNQQIVDMQRLMAQVQPPAPVSEGSGVRFNVAPPPPGRRVTQKEVDEYGQELMDVVGRRSLESVEPLLQQLVGELQQVKRQVGGVQNAHVFDARVQMYKDLAQEVPNWDQVNNSPQFAQWLDQIDPISHQARRSFLNSAHNSNQTGQVVDIFRSFLSTLAPNGPANGGSSPGNGAGGYSQSNSTASTPQLDLMQYAAPGRAKTGQTTVPPEKPIFSATDISQFYRDKTRRRYMPGGKMRRLESRLLYSKLGMRGGSSAARCLSQSREGRSSLSEMSYGSRSIGSN